MKITKQILCDLPSCYAVSRLDFGKDTYILVASDDRGLGYCFDVASGSRQTLWEKPGGVMSMVPWQNGFLAIQRFYPGFNARTLRLRIFPYRFSYRRPVVWPHFAKVALRSSLRYSGRAGVRYLVACTLCTDKKDEQDWSSPGRIYAVELPENPVLPFKLEEIAGGMTRNHGTVISGAMAISHALTACDQGVFELTPPERRGGPWSLRRVLDRPVSDIALSDIDGDGLPEMAAIEPFHGGDFRIYHWSGETWQSFYRYPVRLSPSATLFGEACCGRRFSWAAVAAESSRFLCSTGKMALWWTKQSIPAAARLTL